MAKIYYRRIVAGEMTLEEVPKRWREEVQVLLNKDVQEPDIQKP